MRSNKSAATLAAALAEAKLQAADLGDRIGPAVDDARERLAPLVDDARERLIPVIEDARERLTPVVEDARGRITPVLDDALERLAPVLDDARLRLADLGDVVAAKLDETAPEPAADKGGKLKKVLVVAGVGAAAALAAKQLRGGSAEPQWQSTPPVRTTPAASTEGSGPLAAPASVASMVAADSPDPDVRPASGQADPGGGSPDEAAADAAEGPRPPTTPDAPAERIDLTE